MKSLPDAPDCVLVKTSTDNSRWQTERCSQDRSSWSLYTSKVDLVLHETPPGAKRPLRMVSAFPGKYASIPAELKKLDSWNFCESNLTETRFDRSIRIMTVEGNSGYPLNLSFNNMEKER